jgi:hypothetical protein
VAEVHEPTHATTESLYQFFRDARLRARQGKEAPRLQVLCQLRLTRRPAGEPRRAEPVLFSDVHASRLLPLLPLLLLLLLPRCN